MRSYIILDLHHHHHHHKEIWDYSWLVVGAGCGATGVQEVGKPLLHQVPPRRKKKINFKEPLKVLYKNERRKTGSRASNFRGYTCYSHMITMTI